MTEAIIPSTDELPQFAHYKGNFITPRLAVGPLPRPEHVDEIAAMGINGIINVLGVGHRKDMAYVQHLPEHVHWRQLGMWDGTLADQSVSETLSEAYARYLVQAAAIVLRDHAPVLIHCRGGVARSAHLAGVLLAAEQHITAEQAVAQIQRVRPRVVDLHDHGHWRAAGEATVVALAREVLDEPATDPATFGRRVREGASVARRPMCQE